MNFHTEEDREAYIGFLMKEIEADNDNLGCMYPRVGTMVNKTGEKNLEVTIKRFTKHIEKNEKLIDEAVEARISPIALDVTHMSSYRPDYEIFKG